MLIDFKTGEKLPSNPTITTTQSLMKVDIEITDKTGIDFNNINNNDWEKILENNRVYSPSVLIDCLRLVLKSIKNNDKFDPTFLEFMSKQCEGWQVTDSFTTIEDL